MSIQRHFLGCDTTLLNLGVDHLVDRFTKGRTLDLDRLVIAVPGGRAGRRLLEMLVERTENLGLTLLPPEIVTVGKLPELLYVAKNPFADSMVQQLAWVAAMKGLDAERLARFVPQPPESDDLMGWLALGEMLARLHRELAADALDFEKVYDCGKRLHGFPQGELARWQVLVELQKVYHEILDRNRLWDLQTARIFALEYREYTTDRKIILFGTVDLNRCQRKMLDQIADRVTALVFAPESWSERFDEYGCLIPEKWENATIDIPDAWIDVVDGPAEQATAAVRALESLDGKYSPESITFGVPDVRLVAHLEQQLRQCGVRPRYGVGRPISRTEPYALLAAVAEYLDRHAFSDWAALVRRPSVQAWLERRFAENPPAEKNGTKTDWLSEMDRYQNDRLPYRIDRSRPPQADHYPLLLRVFEALDPLFLPMEQSTQPLAQWSSPLADWLLEFFGSRPLDPNVPEDRAVLTACEKIRTILANFEAIPAELMPTVSVSEAISLLFAQVGSETIAPPPDRGAIEMVGWLELPMDDAPALIVTGMNEGIVPSSLNADLFLPNALREALGIEDNRRRLARDAYALSLLVRSDRSIHLIAGRRSAEGDPLIPSRLLLTGQPETIARRVVRFFDDAQHGEASLPLPGVAPTPPAESRFSVPKPMPLSESVRSMRVTEFRDYLACPYRYYLKHRLRLESREDRTEELDGGAFGSLAHTLLDHFGHSEAAASENEETIGAFLKAELDRLVGERYGEEPSATILIQIEQLRLRFEPFARHQASWAAQGWRIQQVEASSNAAALEVDGHPMFLRGQIDRIDLNRHTGQLAILDYKTSDSGKTPEQTHRKNDEWADLQLPLYRHLLTALGFEDFDTETPIELGYILLPKDLKKSRFAMADWTESDLRDADAKAAEIIRAVRQQRFWPPTNPAPPFSEVYAAICMDGHMGNFFDNDEEEEAIL